MEVGGNATLREGDVVQELGKLLVVAHGECDGTGRDAALLQLVGDLCGELEELRREVLEDSREVDGCRGCDTLGVATLAEHGAHATDGELKSETAADGLVRGRCLASALGLVRLGGGHCGCWL
jgi:hypothetical protein